MNFFGLNENNLKTVKSFDHWDQIAWNKAKNTHGTQNVFDTIEAIKQTKWLKHVHHKDKWEIFSFLMIEIDKREYGYNIVCFPHFLNKKYENELYKMDYIGYNGEYKCQSGRVYLLAFQDRD